VCKFGEASYLLGRPHVFMYRSQVYVPGGGVYNTFMHFITSSLSLAYLGVQDKELVLST
jgi:hypothetical protein